MVDLQSPAWAQGDPVAQVGLQVGAAHWYAFGPVVGQFCDAQSLFASQASPSAQCPAHDGGWQ
jgi:hypothetical protein